ncbi:protein NETWORKED 4B [Elaeis guineensis]|uniref:protein NETWORKED 4B n=1 Tax=Elaeis guineensis var. tenera TaxID=51953 RepID=UPI003C6D7889
MKRMASKKSHSWWWDSHISPKNSKWLMENLEEMDKRVKEMLKLIEEEGDSFAKKAEMYYERRPVLISHVEDFYRMYRALAERYDNVTGELRKNVQSELQSQGSGTGSDFGSEPPLSPTLSPELTPECKPPRPKPSPRTSSFHFFLGSGGSSDVSRKGSDGSLSSSSDSESESDDTKEVNVDSISSRLHDRILELEDELSDVREKLRIQEDKCFNDQCEHMDNGNYLDFSLKISALEEELISAKAKLQDSEAEIVSLQNKLEERNGFIETENIPLSLEKKQVAELEKQIAMLEADISAHKNEIEDLKGAMAASSQKFEAELSDRDLEIGEYKTELVNLSERFLKENSSLEADVENLEGVIKGLNAEVDRVSGENLLLEARLEELENVIKELEARAASSAEKFLQEKSALEAEAINLSQSNASLECRLSKLEDDIRQLEAEKMEASKESGKHIAELNQSLDALILKLEILTSEKEAIHAKVDTLINDVKCRDDRISQMDEHLRQLHLEHAELIVEIEEVQKADVELRKLVRELEEEVDRQKVEISDGAEGKREAIRQLCFSLEHYRDGYHHLRQLLQGHKRPVVMAT